MNAHRAISLSHRRKALQEAVPVLALRRGPSDFGYCGRAGQCHQLDALFRADVLGPDVRLQAEDVFSLSLGERRIAQLEAIHVFERDHAHAARRFRWAGALAIIEIERGPRRKNGVVPGNRAA